MKKMENNCTELFNEAIDYQVEGILEPGKRLESWRIAYKCAERGAKLGSAECLYLLGLFHVKEVGCEQDFGLAFSYFQQSAELGYYEAEFFLGDWYYSGIATTRNIFEARIMFERSADKGFAPAQFALGRWYRDRGNEEQAIMWYRTSLEQRENLSLYFDDKALEDAESYLVEHTHCAILPSPNLN